MAATQGDRPVPRPVQHPGPCGARHDPPCGDLAYRPLLVAETLRNHDTLCHGCGTRFRPGDLPICGPRERVA